MSQEQFDIVERIKLKWLRHMEHLLDEGTITSTDLATLSRLLAQNGWQLDPSRVPTTLRDKLTSDFDPTVVDDDDVIPIRQSAAR